jgi:hypothetical protein
MTLSLIFGTGYVSPPVGTYEKEPMNKNYLPTEISQIVIGMAETSYTCVLSFFAVDNLELRCTTKTTRKEYIDL